MLRQTRTYAVLEVPDALYQFVHDKLEKAGYDHTFDEHGGKPVIDMSGIALAPSAEDPQPIPMFLACPVCHEQHIDAPKPEVGWLNPPHKTHLCRHCGTLWRPAAVHTTGVSNDELGRLLGVPGNAVAATGVTGP